MNLKYQNFLADVSNQDLAIPHPQPIISQIPEREKIKHTLTGSSKAVIRTIQILHQLGYANMQDWTPLLPTSNPGEVMSILVRSITVQQ
ncbi:MAG: hypothetical protein HC836_26600 [Richelia sp. RM2_1_2]|nr:hypothetical protein [Richelia sp. RM2_1_2]